MPGLSENASTMAKNKKEKIASANDWLEPSGISVATATVKGVVVVCEGGDLPQVQQRIIEAVTTALNISSKRVCVTKSS